MNDWMRSSVGISFHWTTHSVLPDGGSLSFAGAAERFDAESFVKTAAESGADHVIFTLTHAEQYLALPCAALEAILPGRTTRRDLIGEIAAGLRKKGVRFIAYYNHSCNGDDDLPWKEACGYAASDLDRFAGNVASIVADIAARYGENLAGWWFDSAYSVDPRGPHDTITCDMGDWRFPWEDLIRAAKSGNAAAAVAINAGIGSNFLYAPRQDYYAGETVDPDEIFRPDELPGIVGHRWICLDSLDWVFHRGRERFSAPRFSPEELCRFTRRNLEA
ncbi:MAG: alpha-L-fucosidase, partial [Clostridia bacterium]|nr:alpha-L-fucosidase [Clostridia bacterium]